MNGILIDLGPLWGHIVSLDMLTRIVHIEVLETTRIRVVCSTKSSLQKTKKEDWFEFTSKPMEHDYEISKQTQRLMGFSNGVISESDMKNIIKGLEMHSGKKIDVVLSEPLYDIQSIRKYWADVHDEPYFRFVIQYDSTSKQMMINEDHNNLFKTVIPKWVDETSLELLSDTSDHLLLMAYEVMYNLVEPILPEPEHGAFTDPLTNIPVLGDPIGSTTQRVDLSKIGPNTSMASMDGKQ